MNYQLCSGPVLLLCVHVRPNTYKLNKLFSVMFSHVVIDCGPPEEPSNGRVILPSDQTYLNDIANYTCATGYILQGNEHRVCQLNGLWSGSVPSCVGEFNLSNGHKICLREAKIVPRLRTHHLVSLFS